MTKTRSIFTHINKLLPKAKTMSRVTRTRSNQFVRTTASNLFGQPQRLFHQSSNGKIAAKMHERSITTVHDLSGLYDIFSDTKKSGSPWHGVILSETGTLEKMYDQAATEHANQNTTLILNLFHKLENEFRVTRHKAYAGFALTPQLIAKIVYHLENESINDPEIKKAITDEWAATYLEKAKYKKAQNADADEKVSKLLDLIIAAKNECLQNGVLPNLTETILLGFLYHKANSRDEILEYIQARHELAPNKTKLPKTNAMQPSECSENQLDDLMTALNNSRKKLSSHPRYIEFITAIVSHFTILKPVNTGQYSYKEQPARPNCTEVAFHNLCNVLLLNRSTGRFDLSLLPANARLNPAVVRMYQTQEGTIEINSRKVGQQFMDILSDRDTLLYTKDKNYEVSAKVSNIIPVLNILFDCNAASLQEFSAMLSDDRRNVQFTLNDNRLSVTIKQKNMEIINCDLIFTEATLESPRHCSFESSIFDKSHFLKPLNQVLNQLPVNKIVEDQLLFPLIVSIIHLSSEHHLKQMLDAIKAPEQCLMFLMNFSLDNRSLSYSNTRKADLVIQACLPFAQSNKAIALKLALLTHHYHNELLRQYTSEANVTKFNSLMNLRNLCALDTSDQTLFNMLFDNHSCQMLDAILTYANDKNIINKSTKETGYTLLVNAVSRGNIELTKQLIKLGAYVNHRDIYGMSALDVATSESIIRLLLEHNAVVENMHQVAKILAVFSVNEKIPFLTSHLHLIYSATDLKLAINSLSFNPAAQTDFIYSIKHKVTDVAMLSIALNNLPNDKRMEFATACVNQIGIDDNDNYQQGLRAANKEVTPILVELRQQYSPAQTTDNRRPR